MSRNSETSEKRRLDVCIENIGRGEREGGREEERIRERERERERV